MGGDKRQKKCVSLAGWGNRANTVASIGETYVAEHAQEDVDDGISGADTTLHPYYNP